MTAESLHRALITDCLRRRLACLHQGGVGAEGSGSDGETTVTTRVFRRRVILKVCEAGRPCAERPRLGSVAVTGGRVCLPCFAEHDRRTVFVDVEVRWRAAVVVLRAITCIKLHLAGSVFCKNVCDLPKWSNCTGKAVKSRRMLTVLQFSGFTVKKVNVY